MHRSRVDSNENADRKIIRMIQVLIKVVTFQIEIWYFEFKLNLIAVDLLKPILMNGIFGT